MDLVSHELDYASPRKRRPIPWSIRRINLCLIGVALVCYIVLSLIAPDTHTTISVCTKCGVYEEASESYLPFTSIPLRQTRTLNHTPLSAVVQKHQLRTGHTHQFLFAISSKREFFGHGCGVGPGRHLETNNAALFIDGLAKYSDMATTEKWLDMILDPNRDHSDDMLVIPIAGFASQPECRQWAKAHPVP